MSSMPGTMPHASRRLSHFSHSTHTRYTSPSGALSTGGKHSEPGGSTPVPTGPSTTPSMELGHSRQRQAPPSTSAGTLLLLRGNSAYLKSCYKQ